MMMTAQAIRLSDFTFDKLAHYFSLAQDKGYRIMTCAEYFHNKTKKDAQKILVNRVDIDVSVKKAERIAKIFNDLNCKASFFIRLHAKEYNPFDFENYRILKFIRDSGHEIGYHSEVIDEAAIWQEDPVFCLKRDLAILENILQIKIKGVASHGGMTGLNNLHFWQNHHPEDFGLLYEAYDKKPEFNLFDESFYISDSAWTYWKCYNHGKLLADLKISLGEHLTHDHPLIYTLIHPETYYDHHFYE